MVNAQGQFKKNEMSKVLNGKRKKRIYNVGSARGLIIISRALIERIPIVIVDEKFDKYEVDRTWCSEG